MKKTAVITWYLYLLLIVMLGVGLYFFFSFAGMPDRQFTIVIATAVGYVVWGTVLHTARGDAHPKIVIEYVLMAILAVVLLRGAIFR